MLSRVRSVEFYVTPCTTRLPFRFGVVTMTEAPLLLARAELELEGGQRAWGCSSDLLVPKWFDKDPDKDLIQDRAELIASARAAASCFAEHAREPLPLFELWRRVYVERVESSAPLARDRLMRGFGVALIERALMDALCRAAGCSFFEALGRDLFGFEPTLAIPELAGWDLRDDLPPRPLEQIRLRHTVGLADPLRAAEVPAPERVLDGLPQTLEEDIETYGLSCFKLKLCGDRSRDLPRLLQIAAVLEERVAGAPLVTVDGNEQFADALDLARLLDELGAHPAGARLLEGLALIEQPLPRLRSFEPGLAAGIEALSAHAPVIIDEADFGLESFPLALERGYRGVSVKNCKGVFRALINRGVAERAGLDAFQSAEDLTNLAAVALQQDLCTVAALGLSHVERNGHHYFRGLDHLPRGEARAALAAHPDLYVAGDGPPRLRIDGGQLGLSSLDCVGYGYDFEPDLTGRTPLGEWEGAPR